jgi:hypothetical protein
MKFFLVAHFFDDCATPCIVSREFLQMPAKVLAYLSLGFFDEAERPFVAKQSARCTDCKGTGIPDRAEPAGTTAKFSQALMAPAKVISFFVGGILHLLFDTGIACDRRVSLVQALRSDFTSVVDSHQPGSVIDLVSRHELFRDAGRRALPCRNGRSCHYSAKRVVEAADNSIRCSEFPFAHVRHYSAVLAGIGRDC